MFLEQKPTKRIEYIDAIRGFNIILLVYCHVIKFGYYAGQNLLAIMILLNSERLFFRKQQLCRRFGNRSHIIITGNFCFIGNQ